MINKKYIKNAPLCLGFLFIALTSIRTISNPEFWTHLSHNKLGNLAPSYLQNELIKLAESLDENCIMMLERWPSPAPHMRRGNDGELPQKRVKF